MDSSKNDENIPDSEIIQAEVVDMAPGTPWDWREVRVVRPPHRRWRMPVLLFVATCLSTLYVGIPNVIPAEGGGWAALLHGLRYAVPVMTILLCHEMGHFLQAHRYGVRASLPYFIPMPFSPLGTFGAVIAMEPRVGGRRALFDIGISGPLAGLVPTLIFCIVGSQSSELKLTPPHPHGMAFGSPILFDVLCQWRFGAIPANYDILLDPMAFAGWVGLLVTSLNLIPIGQLDGGHVLYALLLGKAHRVASLLLMTAVFLVIWNWDTLGGWLLMLFLLLLMGPIHPPTADDSEPLGLGRVVLGWLTLAFIIVGFTPTPLKFLQ